MTPQSKIPIIDDPDEVDKVDLRELTRRIENAELQLLRMKVRNVALLDSCLDGVLIVDARGHILAANSHACEMFGYTIDELLFQIVEVLVPDHQRAAHVHHRNGYNLSPKSRPMGQGIAMGLQGRRKDASLFNIGISLTRIIVEGTPITCLVCTQL
jgi:PAS domain S-box-containing protein